MAQRRGRSPPAARTRVEEALRASEAKYRTLVDGLPAVTYRSGFGEQGEWLYVSPQIHTLLGYTPAEWMADPALWYSRMHPEDRMRVMDEETRTRHTGQRFISEYRLLARDGRQVWVHDEAWPIRDAAGEPAFLQGVLLDITQRMQVEETARESARRYRMLVDSVEGIVWEADAHTLQFTFVSRQAERLLGYPIERWTSDPTFWRDHIHPDDRDWAVDYCKSAVRERRPHEFEYRMIAADGRTLWLRDILSVVVEPEESVSLRGVMVDIGARKRAEEDLESSERRQALMLGSLPMALYRTTVGDALGMTWIGDEIRHITGFPADRFLADPQFWESRIHPEDRDRVFRELAATVPDGAAASEYRWRCADGEYRWFLDQNVVVRDAGGAPREIFGFCLSIHERKQVEEAQRRTEERLRLIGLATHDAIWDWDLANDTVWWSAGFQSIFGHTQDQLDSTMEGYFSRVHPEDLERVRSGVHAVIEGGAPSWVGEFRFRRGDGTYAYVYDRGFVVHDATGKSVRMVGSMMDITERKRLEDQLRQAVKMEAVGRLAGGIAHDFNNLLTAITGYADLLLADLDPHDPRRGDVTEINRSAQRAAALTQQLLAFSRQQVLQPRVLDLNAAVGRMESLLRRLIGEHIELRTRLQPGLGRVKADPGQLEQVVVNLAVNARDAMQRGGTLILETADVALDAQHTKDHMSVTPGRYVMLAVQDSGTGMDDETKRHLFEPFYTTKGPGKGTGLGLATVYGIVKQSGGYIFADSELDRGTTFRIYLPRADELVEATAPAATPAPVPRGTETVLLAEDEDAVRAVARKSLKRQGYAVIEARSAAEALELADGHHGPIHLLLTDVVMPGMGGKDLALAVQGHRPDVRVLYMSGYTDDAIVHHGVLEPGTDFIQKPFTPEMLARKVREVLGATPGS